MSWLGKIPAAIVVSGQQLANGTVSALKFAAGAVVAHLGYTPANKAGDTFTGPVSISSGDLTLSAGNLVVANGKGIDFSAHSNATGMTSELLDDYETGSWTPQIQALGNDMSVTYGVQFGSYVKIGKLVFVKGYMLINAIANKGSSGVRLAGLPFAPTEEVNFRVCR
jgi:lipopolysaccharide export system protein LptA